MIICQLARKKWLLPAAMFTDRINSVLISRELEVHEVPAY